MVVMPAPSKRGRKKKTTLSRVGPVVGAGNDTLILAHLTAGGQVKKDMMWEGKSEIIKKNDRTTFNIILICPGDNFAASCWRPI